jgi:hypothetical protein
LGEGTQETQVIVSMMVYSRRICSIGVRPAPIGARKAFLDLPLGLFCGREEPHSFSRP